jgi:hypothetical protein
MSTQQSTSGAVPRIVPTEACIRALSGTWELRGERFVLEKEPEPPAPGETDPGVDDGGCGCSVTARPGLVDMPAGTVLVLVAVFTLGLRCRYRRGKGGGT